MIVTKQQLQQLIDEEFERVLKRRLDEHRLSASAYDLDPTDLMDFAKACMNMGPAVFEQLDRMLSEGPSAEVNPNAVDVMEEEVGGMNGEIDQALKEWHENGGEEGVDEDYG